MANGRDLLAYLTEVIDMEKSVYLQDKLLRDLRGQYNAVNYIAPEVEKPALREEKTTGLGKYVAGVAFLVLALHEFSKGTFMSVGGGMLLTLIGIGALGAAGTGRKVELSSAVSKQNRAAMDSYSARVAARDEDYRRRLPRIRVLEAEIAQLEAGLSKSRAVLGQMYGVNVIYPAYRGLANVCAIYDYIASGAAKTLPEAYRILIAHIDAGEIITSLDRINSKLDQVLVHQHRTYLAITEANEKIDQLQRASENMSRELERLGGNLEGALQRIQHTSQLTAYYSERSARQLEYLNHMSYYSGVFGNASAMNMPPAG